jgi:hypothetical protein
MRYTALLATAAIGLATAMHAQEPTKHVVYITPKSDYADTVSSIFVSDLRDDIARPRWREVEDDSKTEPDVCLYFSVVEATDYSSTLFVNIYGTGGRKESKVLTLHIARHAEADSAETIIPALDSFYSLLHASHP